MDDLSLDITRPPTVPCFLKEDRLSGEIQFKTQFFLDVLPGLNVHPNNLPSGKFTNR